MNYKFAVYFKIHILLLLTFHCGHPTLNLISGFRNIRVADAVAKPGRSTHVLIGHLT